MKCWEIIAERLSARVEVGAASQPLISKGEQSGLLTRTAMTPSASLCTQMKSWPRLRNSNQQSGCIGEIRAICGSWFFRFSKEWCWHGAGVDCKIAPRQVRWATPRPP